MKDIFAYNEAVKRMRMFFQDMLNFVEVPAQSRLTILSACEDPKTLTKFSFDGTSYSLPQTGQMQLEYELLKNPEVEGVFCVSTSFRNEPNPIEGRHQKVFPMFEFETTSENFSDLILLEKKLLAYMGFKGFSQISYEEACTKYKKDTIEAETEEQMYKDGSHIAFLHHFPYRSEPFWNMKRNKENPDLYNKVDVIMHGQETIGSAERSCDPNDMLERFYTLADGGYAAILEEHFGKERVRAELDEFLSLPFIPRVGGGIGVGRMARAMELSGLFDAVKA